MLFNIAWAQLRQGGNSEKTEHLLHFNVMAMRQQLYFKATSV